MTNDFHPSQWQGFYSAYWSAQIASWGFLVGALVTIGVGTGLKPPHLKAIAFAGTLGCCALAQPQRKTVRRLQGHIRDIEDLSDAGFQQFVWSKLSQVSAAVQSVVNLGEATIEELPRYDLAETRHNNHTIIAGPTGSGKSELTKYLISSYFQGANVQVYDSDCEPQDWQGLTVVGREGDFIGISGAMVEDLKLLDQRCKLRGRGRNVGAEEVRICEEFPAVASELTELIEGRKSSAAAHWLKRIARRGRKYKIKLILVTQETSVAAMGIEGEGGVRKAFTIVYLGGAAVEAAERMKDKALSRAFLDYFSQCDRPCLVDHKGRWYVADVPTLASSSYQFSPVPSVSALPAKPQILSQSLDPVQYLHQCLELDSEESESRFTLLQLSEAEAKNRIAELRTAGMNQTQIILALWGVKKGGSAGYQQALAEYKQLMRE